MKPTKAQLLALAKLTDEWQSPYTLRERFQTLDGLVTRKLAEKRMDIGYMFMPRTAIKYRITELGKVILKGEIDVR